MVAQALALRQDQLRSLESAWKTNDGRAMTCDTRQDVLDRMPSIGLSFSYQDLAQRLCLQMPDFSAPVRGAVLDVILAWVGGHFFGQEDLAILNEPWGQLPHPDPSAGWPSATAEKCSHGSSWGHCRQTGCPGGYEFAPEKDYDWRDDR